MRGGMTIPTSVGHDDGAESGGITVTGGGALLAGLDRHLASETGMPINIANEPLYSVVLGSGRALENIDALRGVFALGGDD